MTASESPPGVTSNRPPANDGGDPFGREHARIRAVYAERDRRPARSAAIVKAYELINSERLGMIRGLVLGSASTAFPRILDVGCGTGFDLGYWRSTGWPADALAGVDLIEDRVRQARSRCPGVDIRVSSGTDLPFPDATFDAATAVTVFSSILDELPRQALFQEMCRVVRPQGLVLVYDFVVRKPGNRDVVPMNLGRLMRLGRPPSASKRLSPLLHLVALGTYFGGIGTRVAMAMAPRTHRLTSWRMPGPAGLGE